MTRQEIPIFFSADDNYVPCLSVAIKSLVDNSSKENDYKIMILNAGMDNKSKKELKEFEGENIKIDFKDISTATKKIAKALSLRLRDYYSATIYYRMFIPSMFPEYEKAIYLDSDIVLLDDIVNFYNMDLGTNLLAVVKDEVVNGNASFRKYSKIALGLDAVKYFNSGVLLMNLKAIRENKIEDRFISMLVKYNLDTIAPDQDYLNVLCKDKVLYLPENWNKMPDFGKKIKEDELHLIHYNMYRKPWHYADVPYSNVFWRYAKETKYYELLQENMKKYSEKEKKDDIDAGVKLVKYSEEIMTQDIKFVDIIDKI